MKFTKINIFILFLLGIGFLTAKPQFINRNELMNLKEDDLKPIPKSILSFYKGHNSNPQKNLEQNLTFYSELKDFNNQPITINNNDYYFGDYIVSDTKNESEFSNNEQIIVYSKFNIIYEIAEKKEYLIAHQDFNFNKLHDEKLKGFEKPEFTLANIRTNKIKSILNELDLEDDSKLLPSWVLPVASSMITIGSQAYNYHLYNQYSETNSSASATELREKSVTTTYSLVVTLPITGYLWYDFMMDEDEK